jgi:hypothetical protein
LTTLLLREVVRICFFHPSKLLEEEKRGKKRIPLAPKVLDGAFFVATKMFEGKDKMVIYTDAGLLK